MVMLHIPFEIPVERCRIEVIEELHADQPLLVIALEFKVAVDFAVVRLNEFALVITHRTNAEGVATVGVTVVESLAIAVVSLASPLHADPPRYSYRSRFD